MLENLKTESSPYRILVVDDEELIRNLVVNGLSELGHSWITAIDGVDALNKMGENKFDAVITDITMPNMDGIILTREISNQYPIFKSWGDRRVKRMQKRMSKNL